MHRSFRIILITLFLACGAVQAADVKLDYKQQQLLKDATSYLDEAEGIGQELAKKIKDWKVGDSSIQIATVNNYIDGKDKALQRVGYAENRFKELPATNTDVKAQVDRAKTVKESLATSAKKLDEVHKGLKGIVDQGGSVEYKKDFDRLKEITQMFGNTQVFNTYPDGAITICTQMAPVKAERERMAKKYADLLKQSTGESEQMNSVLRYFDDQFGQFEKAANQYASEAPGAIDQAIDENVKTAKDAAAERKLGFFGPNGGINSTFKQTEVRYNILAAIQPTSPQTAAARKKIDDGYAQVKQIRASLDEQLLATNLPPDDQYNGQDKQQMLDAIKAKWSQSGVAGDVLKSGINSSEWKRDAYWRFDGTDTFHKTDLSKAQGYVVVKTDDKVATVYYINLTKDHLANDKIEAFFFDDPKTKPDVTRKMLLANVK
jgi:hypothetical protein